MTEKEATKRAVDFMRAHLSSSHLATIMLDDPIVWEYEDVFTFDFEYVLPPGALFVPDDLYHVVVNRVTGEVKLPMTGL